MKPMRDDERKKWKGWVELESDPVSILCHVILFFSSVPGVLKVDHRIGFRTQLVCNPTESKY